MCLQVWKELLALVAFFSLNPHFLQNKKQLVGGCSLDEAFGVGDRPRKDALGKVHMLGGPGTNPALCLATAQDPCVPLILRDLHPEGQLCRVLAEYGAGATPK